MVVISFAFACSFQKWLFASSEPLQQWLAPSRTNEEVRPKSNVSAVGGFLCRFVSTNTEVGGPQIVLSYPNLKELAPDIESTFLQSVRTFFDAKADLSTLPTLAEQVYDRPTKAIIKPKQTETNGCRHSLQLLNQSDIHAQPSETCYVPQTAAV